MNMCRLFSIIYTVIVTAGFQINYGAQLSATYGAPNVSYFFRLLILFYLFIIFKVSYLVNASSDFDDFNANRLGVV